MDLWALVFLVCLWFALKGAGSGIRNGYRKKVEKWDAENPNGNRWHRRGAMWAYFFKMLKDGPGYALRGWKEGWEEGKAKADEKWGQSEPDPQAAQEKVDLDKPDPKPATEQPKPKLKLVPPPDGGHNPGGPVAIEVVNVETLYSWAEEKEKLAATDLEDAKLAKKRVEEEITSTTQVSDWMTGQKFTKEDKGLIKPGVSEAEKAELDACDRLIAARQKKLDAATAVKNMATKHKQFQQSGAAGQPYNGG